MQQSEMNSKAIVSDLLQRLPEQVTLHQIAQEIEFIAAVRQGLAEVDREETVPLEDVEQALPSWIIR